MWISISIATATHLLPKTIIVCYTNPMNARTAHKDAKFWHQPSSPAATQVEGYDIYLEADLANGLADLDAGRATPVEDVRKEFGLE